MLQGLRSRYAARIGVSEWKVFELECVYVTARLGVLCLSLTNVQRSQNRNWHDSGLQSTRFVIHRTLFVILQERILQVGSPQGTSIVTNGKAVKHASKFTRGARSFQDAKEAHGQIFAHTSMHAHAHVQAHRNAHVCKHGKMNACFREQMHAHEQIRTCTHGHVLLKMR